MCFFDSFIFPRSQWNLLGDMCKVALHATQYLKCIFLKKNVVDFNEISLQALDALGTENIPTNLALYLDYQIKHILIDEFQDTSILQYKILKMLTIDWQITDKKTLFLVGDPMQSIYRFRQAEVNLFIQTRDFGINQIKPISLKLSHNFRSNTNIVKWINKTFVKVFPKNDCMEFSGISFTESYTNQVSLSEKIEDSVSFFCYNDASEEASSIVKEVNAYQYKNPNGKIAILVRTRGHLRFIIEAFRKNKILFEEHEIESLYDQEIIKILTQLP